MADGLASIDRRSFLQVAGISTFGFRLFDAFCHANPLPGEQHTQKPTSLILLWLDGGPSQLETFDPHPGTKIAGPTKAVSTNVPGVQLASGLPRLAEKMDRLTLIRSVVGTEVDHVRGTYLAKTGFVGSASIVHPTMGSICAAYLPDRPCDLPSFITIIATTSWVSTSVGGSEGGYLGDQYNPFRIGDPLRPPANLRSRVSPDRFRRRLAGFEVIEGARAAQNEQLERQLGTIAQMEQAVKMMTSPQSRAFSVDQEPIALRQAYGDNPFGRSCLAARRLVESGVRCVEIQLSSWDTHVNNFSEYARLNAMLDPGFSALISDLEERNMLDSTVVLCMGEFGRTPKFQGKDGRDHWPYGFSVALTGGRIRKGVVIGETDPMGSRSVKDPVSIATLTATVLAALGLNPATERIIGERPVKLSDGKPLPQLLVSR